MGAAHVDMRLKPIADARTVRRRPQPTTGIVGKLYATHAGGFAIGHTRNRRADRRRDATSTAPGTTFHQPAPFAVALVAGERRSSSVPAAITNTVPSADQVSGASDQNIQPNAAENNTAVYVNGPATAAGA